MTSDYFGNQESSVSTKKTINIFIVLATNGTAIIKYVMLILLNWQSVPQLHEDNFCGIVADSKIPDLRKCAFCLTSGDAATDGPGR